MGLFRIFPGIGPLFLPTGSFEKRRYDRLFWLFSRETAGNWCGKLAGAGSVIFLVGFVGSEAALFLAGLGFMLPYLPAVLLVFSVGLLAGVGILAWTFSRKVSQRSQVTQSHTWRTFAPLQDFAGD